MTFAIVIACAILYLFVGFIFLTISVQLGWTTELDMREGPVVPLCLIFWPALIVIIPIFQADITGKICDLALRITGRKGDTDEDS